MHDWEQNLVLLARQVRRAEWRIRLDDVLARTGALLPLLLTYALAALTYVKLRQPEHGTEQKIMLAGGVLVVFSVAALVAIGFRRRPKYFGALLLDRHYGLADRITSALTFLELPPERRTPLMNLCIADAARLASEVRARRAAPFRLRDEWKVAAVLAVGLLALAALEVRITHVLPPGRSFEPIELSADDIDLFRDAASDLEQKTRDSETLAAVRRFNQLIEDIAQRRLDRREVFERLERLERELGKAAEADRRALDEGLNELARELAKSTLSKPIAEHLEQKRIADAEKAMRDLAEKLRKKGGAPSKAELDQLRDALARASRASSDNSKKIEQRRRELERERQSLLNKSQPDAGANAGDKSLLKKKERELERLDRERDQAARRERQLSRLDRELERAAEDLMRELSGGADDLERGAEDLNRMQKQEMTEQEKQQMLRRLQEMRELLRQQGQGGRQHLERLQRFSQSARGGGQGQAQKSRPGQAQTGRLLRAGKGDDLLLTRGAGSSSQPAAQGSPEGAGNSQGTPATGDKGDPGNEGGGKNAGTSHNPNLRGEASNLKSRTKDVTAVAADTGQGAASSEVIYGAAQRGFVGGSYRKIYTDYHTVAEQVLNRDQIPPGYRFYVQRYFQLIRPRE